MNKKSNNNLQIQISQLTTQLKASKKREANWKIEAKQYSVNASYWRRVAEPPSDDANTTSP